MQRGERSGCFIAAKTVSFVKGKGSLRHNNREFIANNVDPARIEWNVTYVKMPLEDAYEQCFGDAVREYNVGQKRKDRRKDNYLEEIRHSGNGEKVFYENVVQIGTMKDTPVIDQDGNLTEDAIQAIHVLNQYAETFQERNPNLFLFNAVLHLDEATPHLHLDYIPVAHGYKKGLKTRNSLTKALQEMGFEKGKSRKDNETIDWQSRERAYLGELCAEQGIEVTVLGVDRDNYSLPEYKEIMWKISEKEAEIEILNSQKEITESELFQLQEEQSEFISETEHIREEIEAELENAINQLSQYQLTTETMDSVGKSVQSEMRQLKQQAVPVRSLLKKEEYVKIPRKVWIHMLSSYESAVRQSKTIRQLTTQIQQLKVKTAELSEKWIQCRSFLQEQGLQSAFEQFLHPSKRSVLDRLYEKQAQIPKQREPVSQRQKKKELVDQRRL